MEFLLFILITNNNLRFLSNTGDYLEWPEFDISLNGGITELTSNKSFSVKDSVFRVTGNLILSRISNKTFSLSESYIRGGSTVTLIISNDFNAIILPHTYT
jgi:hypothetical protein